MTTLIFFADISWEGLHQRPHHLASRFAEEYRVIWVEPVVLSKRPSFDPVRVRKNLFVLSLPVFPYNARQKFVRSLASMMSRVPAVRALLSRYQARILRRAIAACGGTGTETIFFFENIYAVHVLEYFDSPRFYYDYIDNFFGFVPLPKHVKRDWEHTVGHAETIFVTSPTLKRQIGRIRTHDVELVANGVEYDFFSRPSQSAPADIPTDQPVVGYVGAVYPWMDFDLIERLCDEIPAMNIVMIGRAHPEIAGRIESLGNLRNFTFLGFREYSSIPSYVHRFTVGIIPFLRNELTEGVNPVKLYEYCAAGVPVVTTDFSPDLAAFVPHIAIGRTREEFIAAVHRAREKKNNPEYTSGIQAFAAENDWAGKAGVILRHLRAAGRASAG